MSIEIKENHILERVERFIDRCTRCAKGPMVADASRGELFCSSCGYVAKEKIEDRGVEWRAFSSAEFSRRGY